MTTIRWTDQAIADLAGIASFTVWWAKPRFILTVHHGAKEMPETLQIR